MVRRSVALVALVLAACLLFLPQGARASASGDPAPAAGQGSLQDTLTAAIKADVQDGFRQLSGSLGSIFTSSIDMWLTAQAESWLSSVSGSFGSLFLYTPPMRNPQAPWIWTGWNDAFILSLLINGAALLWHGWRLVRPDSEGQRSMGARLLVILLAVLGAYLSLYLIDVGIAVQNHLWSGVLRELLHAGQASHPGAAATLAMVFGHGSGGVAGLVTSMGLLPGLLTVLLVFLLALVALAREILLVLLAIASPVYVAFTAFAADPAPLVGCMHVYVRTLLVQSLFAAAWLVLGFVQSGALGLLGVSPGFLVAIVLALALVGAWIWWVKPVAKTLAHPLSLGGAAVLASIGALGERAGQVLGIVGTLTAQPELAAAGVAVGEASRRAGAAGRALQSSQEARLPLSTRLPTAPERHAAPALYTKRTLEDSKSQPWSAFGVPDSQRSQAADALTRADIPVELHGSELWVLPSQEPAAERIIHTLLRDSIPYWTHRDRYVVIREGVPQVLNVAPPRGVDMGAWKGRW